MFNKFLKFTYVEAYIVKFEGRDEVLEIMADHYHIRSSQRENFMDDMISRNCLAIFLGYDSTIMTEMLEKLCVE